MSNERATTPLPPLPSKEAIEYGRRVVGHLHEKLKLWEAKAEEEDDDEKRRRYRFAAFMLEHDLLGDDEGGCVIVAFDKRKLDDEWRAWWGSVVESNEPAITPHIGWTDEDSASCIEDCPGCLASGSATTQQGWHPPQAIKSCKDCKFSLMQETGYSNYTVEGTDFFCLIGAHPDDGFDAWYGEDKRLLFAAECSKYEAGEGVEMDVEGDNEASLTLRQKALYDAWGNE